MALHTPTRNRIKRWLKRYGPATYQDIAKGIGLSHEAVRACVTYARRLEPGHFWRHSYEDVDFGTPKPMWMPGTGVDCPLTPRRPDVEYYKSYRTRNKERIAAERTSDQARAKARYRRALKRVPWTPLITLVKQKIPLDQIRKDY